MDVNDRPQFLHLEDNPIDAELIREKLEEIWPGCLIEQVDTEPDFILALERGGIDLIIADYVLPTFDGLTALNIVQQRFCHIPFIFVSGIMGEESAIESLKRGATDYVLKQRLTRLIPAVKRALTEVSERAASRKAEEDLKATQFQILQSDKMAAIGQLAAGIAHEINNPVGFVSSNLKTLTDYQMNLGQMISEYRNFIDHLSQAKSTGLDDSEIDNLTASLQTKETELDISFILEDIPNLIRESCEGLDRIK
jgi:CheY-like chemotaxis protein